MNKKYKWWQKAACIIAIILVIVISVFCIGMSIYCHVSYGNKSIEEIPSWAIFWMFTL